MGGRLMVVVGGQYGSEAKGAVTARLALDAHRPLVIRVGGPNAGHTVVDDQGREWKLRHVPVGFVNHDATLALAAGSEVNPHVLWTEVQALEHAGYKIRERIFVDPQATQLDQWHIQSEDQSNLTSRLGSTAKGVGSARAERIWRRAALAGTICNPVDVAQLALDWNGMGRDVIIEGTQGYGLGLHAGHYPFCTSGDCRAVDFLAQCGISPWAWAPEDLQVWVVFRTRPIRVAGNSGPLLHETTWEELGLPEERTTVTNKVRRVGAWDHNLAMQALEANGSPSPQIRIAITMLDQLYPEVEGATDPAYLTDPAHQWLRNRTEDLGYSIDLIGTSPRTMIAGVRYGK
jgi:adenylosuccinate synthase